MGGFDGTGEVETLEQRFAELQSRMHSLLEELLGIQDLAGNGIVITAGYHPNSGRPFISVYVPLECAERFSLGEKMQILAEVNQSFHEETMSFQTQVYPTGGWSFEAVVLEQQ